MRQAAFLEPEWFLLFLLFPGVVFLHVRFWRPRQPVLVLASLSAPEGAAPQYITPPDILLLLRLLALTGIILALANLRTVSISRQPMPAAGIDIMLAMDVSGSMLIEDIKPNRLEGLKNVITHFVAGRSTDRIGLVVYAGESLTWCPLTQDYAYLMRQLNHLDEPALADGTAIGLGLASAVQALSQSKAKSKIVILLTDGENTTGFLEPETAAQLARKNHIKVYTIGVGRTGKAPWPVYDLNGRKTYHYVHVKINEPALRSVADQTGGRFYRAQDATSLRRIYAQIDGLTKSPMGYRPVVRYTAHFRWFVLVAGLFFIVAEVMSMTLLRSLT